MTTTAKQIGVIGLALMSIVMSAPVSQPTIDNPCNLDPSAPIELLPILDLLNGAITEANAAINFCQAYLDKVRSDKVLKDEEFRKYNNESLQLPGLPIRQPEVNISKLNMANIMKQHYNDTSIVILYLNVSITEQIDSDYSRYVTELQNIRSSLYRSLCQIFYITKSINTTITQFLDSSAIPPDMINLTSSKWRYYRNLLVVTQGRLMSQTESTNYVKMIETVSTLV